MGKRIALIHATVNAVQPMLEAFRQYEPSVDIVNVMDEGLLRAVNEQGGVTPQILRRFVDLTAKAEAAGVNGALLTCSVFSPYVPVIAPLFAIPILSVDEAMLEQAVEQGSRIGVVATVAAAGPTTAQLLEAMAREQGKRIEVKVAICPEAFAKLQADPVAHDEIIKTQVLQLADSVDVVVLAQISMARARAMLRELEIPVLTSPESGIRALMERLR